MRKATKTLDIARSTELRDLVAEIERSGEGYVLRLDGRDVALLTPLDTENEIDSTPTQDTKRGHATRRRRRAAEPNDIFLRLAGIADAHLPPDAPTDVSSNTDKYLAEAYYPADQ